MKNQNLKTIGIIFIFVSLLFMSCSRDKPKNKQTISINNFSNKDSKLKKKQTIPTNNFSNKDSKLENKQTIPINNFSNSCNEDSKLKNEQIICISNFSNGCDNIRNCLIKHSPSFYKLIKGFNYTRRYDFLIKVKRYILKDELSYKLIKVLSKKKHKRIINRTHKYGKPILYLYPQKNIDVNIKLKNSNDIIHSYPRYPKNGWSVKVDKKGVIKYNDKNYYSLYWEMTTKDKLEFNEGFLVKKSDIVLFLEDSLAKLGLNYRESQEFIIYWLPILEQNELNLIKFETEEYNLRQPIEILPKPDTFIRIMMIFKKIENKDINIKKQLLSHPQRVGFIAVEWGGTEIKDTQK